MEKQSIDIMFLQETHIHINSMETIEGNAWFFSTDITKENREKADQIRALPLRTRRNDPNNKKPMEKGMERLGVATIIHKDIYNKKTHRDRTIRRHQHDL